MTTRDTLLAAVADMEGIYESVAGEVLEGQAEEYRQRALAAATEGARQLALFATDDDRALANLRVIKARVLLWSWAGAEATRKALVDAWKRWIYEVTETLGDLAMALVEKALQGLIESGLSALADSLGE